MLIINITNQINLDVNELPKIIYKRILNDLTLRNPEYETGMDKPRYIEMYSVCNGALLLPRGYGGTLLKYLRDSYTKFRIEDMRLRLPTVEFGSHNQLCEYEIKAIDQLVIRRQGGVIAPSGIEKKIMLGALARIQQPALWITHASELESVKDATSFFDMDPSEIGIMRNDSLNVGTKLTIVLIQSLNKIDLAGVAERFGIIVIDDAYKITDKSLLNGISQFPALYRIWVSATTECSDSTVSMVSAAAGPIVYSMIRDRYPLSISS